MREAVMPPNRLADCVTKGAGPSLQSILERVKLGVEDLQSDYEQELLVELSRLGKTLEAMTGRAAEERSETLSALYLIAHEVRGLAGSFGYPLLTRIANRLCRYIDDRDDTGSIPLEVIECHVGAMRAVAADKVKGDGGRQGRGLIESLDALIAKNSAVQGTPSPSDPPRTP